MKAYPSFHHIQQDLSTGTLRCESLVQHHLDVIRQQKHLNAFLSVYEEEAILRARAIDKKISQGKAGKLAGLVVGLKDVISYKDHPLQGASRILKGFMAQYNATVVERLLNEDAIIIGRQNCDEFGMGSSNENSAFGDVKNGFDHERVPGGSSGGSAVAVQTGMCRISLGSDTGGSVRQPAAFCGIVGLKPTYARISRHGLAAYASSFDCIGILGSCVDDVALVLEVIAGKDNYDSTASTRPVPCYTDELNKVITKKYRIAYLEETLHASDIQQEIRDTLRLKIDQLKEQGHTVEPVTWKGIEYALPTYYILATAEASSNLSRYDGVRYGYRSDTGTDLFSMYSKTRSEGFGTEVKRRILLGTFALSASYYDAYYIQAQKVRKIIRDQIQSIFSQFNFILLPAAPTTAFRLGTRHENPVTTYYADLFSVQANVAGVPGICVPCGTDSDGLPIGLQLLANDFEETELMRMARMMMSL